MRLIRPLQTLSPLQGRAEKSYLYSTLIPVLRALALKALDARIASGSPAPGAGPPAPTAVPANSTSPPPTTSPTAATAPPLVRSSTVTTPAAAGIADGAKEAKD